MLQNTGTAPGTASKLLFVQGGSTVRGAVVGGLQEATAGSPTSMVFETSAAYANPSERMRITSTGNVGIGTTSPGTKLYVDGGESTFNRGNSAGTIATFRGQNAVKAVIGTATSYFTGNVGIGTTSPGTVHGVSYGTTKLHIDGGTDRGQLVVEGDVLAAIILSDNGATVNQRVFQTSVNGGDYQIKPLNDNGTSTAQGAAITVLHGGNVGIGTTSPTSKLEVAGGDIELSDVAGGITMISPDGTRYRITVANGGTLTVTAV
jgi:hypothetical protein